MPAFSNINDIDFAVLASPEEKQASADDLIFTPREPMAKARRTVILNRWLNFIFRSFFWSSPKALII